jgi:Double zinc ribbon
MHCPCCKADTPAGAKSCIECGTPLKLRCPTLGADTLPRARRCGACSMRCPAQLPASSAVSPPSPLNLTARYVAQKIRVSTAALAGERKQVTVPFADLKGLLELLAYGDPKKAR